MTAGTVSTPLIIPIIPLLTHRAKNHIDTNTPVSIHSDTLGVRIFYTLDGSNPVPAERGSACSSRKYSEPVLLPAGRVSVRAVAVSSDGRRSSTVTKVFSVDSNDTNVVPNHIQSVCPSGGATGSHERPAGSSLRPPELKSAAKRSPPAAPRFLARGLGPGPGPQPGSSQPALSSTNASRVQYETGFMRCTQCLSLHPADPFARFCAQCGAAVPLLPEQRLPPAEGGQTIQCAFCKTVVPVNAETCLVCEASIHQQLQPQASLTLQEHVVCVCCGSGNPAHVSSCLTCETHLQTVWASDAPPVPSAARRMLSCARCQRLNHSDARFCDWCGSKSRHAARCVLCWRCGSSGPPSACYCAACGVSLQASRSDDLQRPTQATPSSDPTPSVKASPLTEDQSTQTVGLYFPSATELHRKHQKEQLRQQVTRDRQLTAISPGRGYWRRQLDHVCAHLRSYAQNNPPFRTLLGEPRLGRVVSAVIQEDQYEASLTISFVSAGREGQQVGPECDAADGLGGARLTETLSSVTEKSAESSSIRNDQSTRLTNP
ncbi:double zinc ribbon and ankyrin repeat-containing protein 1 isoform X2 [Betta splendens]|uniref:Double zinc ribbon and ankyrin repeat-containing protein 1 isoform X2 n=1 Tax=Betta splendens TaxID=158456 RepID=A0A6P7MSX8_BETSP|nr:double zinc ribbon and ankyrin repeat-containing protein 1 isoform X2 [Betta splendens]